jgi:hypothetical protein
MRDSETCSDQGSDAWSVELENEIFPTFAGRLGLGCADLGTPDKYTATAFTRFLYDVASRSTQNR